MSKSKWSDRMSVGDVIRAFRDAPLTSAEEKKDQKSMGEARATGRHLADDLTTTAAVRSYCRAKGISRAMEAYVIEGFKGERMRQGLSENV